MIYADTSALIKLITDEAESEALRAWIAGLGEVPLATNRIGIVELKRVSARLSAPALAAAVTLAQRLDKIEVTGSTLALAEQLPPAGLRTLDALHVASAAQAADVTALLTYDTRMAEAAELAGLPVATPE